MEPRYTVEQLKEAVKESKSVAQVLRKLNIVPAGGNYKVFHNAVEKYGIDTSHFTGRGWAKGIPGFRINPEHPLEDYLTGKIKITSYKLKKRLFKEGVKENKCEKCGITTWLGEPIALELHHIDGVHDNNSLNNLAILCPNCHSQTDTFRSKKRKNPNSVE